MKKRFDTPTPPPSNDPFESNSLWDDTPPPLPGRPNPFTDDWNPYRSDVSRRSYSQDLLHDDELEARIAAAHREIALAESKKKKRTKRLKVGGGIAAAAMALGGGFMALRGSDSETETRTAAEAPAVSTTRYNQDNAPSSTEDSSDQHTRTTLETLPEPTTTVVETIAPIETTPPTTPETSPPIQTEQASPFERTGDPAKDAVLQWFENASTSIVVEPSFTELRLDAPDSEILGAAQSDKLLEDFHANFVVGFKHSSGIIMNVFLSDLNGLPNVEINPQSIAILMSYSLQHAAEANMGFLSPEEIEFMRTADQTGAFTGNQVNLVILNGRDAAGNGVCPEDLREVVGYINTVGKCEVAGFATDVAEYGKKSESTIVIQLGGAGESYPGDAGAAGNEAKILDNLDHEFAHVTTNIVGADKRFWAGKEESAKEAARDASGFVDYVRYDEIMNMYTLSHNEQEHAGYVENAGIQLLEATLINKDEITISDPPDSTGAVHSRIYTAPRLPLLKPPVDIRSS